MRNLAAYIIVASCSSLAILCLSGPARLRGEPPAADKPTPRASLEGHPFEVTALAFTADGKMLASSSMDRTVKLWDPTTGKCVRTLTGHTNNVTSVVFSADGKRLASGGESVKEGVSFGEVKIWDVATGKEQLTLKGHSQWGEPVAFSPDGKTLATGASKGEVRLWDAGTGKEVRTLKGHKNGIRAVAFTPDGKALVSLGAGQYGKPGEGILGEIKVWDAAGGGVIRSFEAHSDQVTSLAIHPDGKIVAVGDGDKVTVWELATGKKVRTLDRPAAIRSVAFSADGRTLAAGGDSGRSMGQAITPEPWIQFWDAGTGRVRAVWDVKGSVTCVAFSSDGKTLASAHEAPAGVIALWDVPVAPKAK